MYRIKPVPRERAAPQVQEWYRQDIETSGTVQSASAIYSHRPAVLPAFRELISAVDEASELPEQIRWLVDAKAASLVGCPS